MTTANSELTTAETAYNSAATDLLQLATFGHLPSWCAGRDRSETAGHVQQQDRYDRAHSAQQAFAAAVLNRAADWFDRYDSYTARHLRRMAATYRNAATPSMIVLHDGQALETPSA
ncbi:hypothetical protein [Streptomyces sp. NPDC051572]|uniref:hypothetical protein n=1 Tax=Streptomyces sp. NPDC051572 TaxID=3155802 RepID=UPI00344B8306